MSLVGTESILSRAVDGSLLSVLQDKSGYYVEWDVLLFHQDLPGVCFFHEQGIAKTFDDPTQKNSLVSKLIHQAEPFLTPYYAGQTHLIWSNIQPNLPDTVNNVTPWDTFQLSTQRHTAIKTLGKALFGADTAFSFLTIAGDVAADLVGAPDVQVIDLPRGSEYEGPPDLYDSLLAGIVERPHT